MLLTGSFLHTQYHFFQLGSLLEPITCLAGVLVCLSQANLGHISLLAIPCGSDNNLTKAVNEFLNHEVLAAMLLGQRADMLRGHTRNAAVPDAHVAELEYGYRDGGVWSGHGGDECRKVSVRRVDDSALHRITVQSHL